MRTSVSLPDKSVTCCSLREGKHMNNWITNMKKKKKKKKHRYVHVTYKEGVIKGGENVSNTKNMLSISNSWSKTNILLFGLSSFPFRLYRATPPKHYHKKLNYIRCISYYFQQKGIITFIFYIILKFKSFIITKGYNLYSFYYYLKFKSLHICVIATYGRKLHIILIFPK